MLPSELIRKTLRSTWPLAAGTVLAAFAVTEPVVASEIRVERGGEVVSSLRAEDFPRPPGAAIALNTTASAHPREWDPIRDLEPAGGDDEPEQDSEEAYAERHCAPQRDGEQCGPGYGRQTEGGGEKVSHKGWPAITGILWKVLADDGRRKVGGSRNDELLGHHGSDRIAGAGGKDVIWGDWDPKDNNTRQRDVLRGGSGNDWIYSSHGHNRISGGPGRDYVWAYYGRGTIDCGPGKQDTARVRLNSAYRVRNCERIKNFCGHGSKPGGGCYKPGEKPPTRRSSR